MGPLNWLGLINFLVGFNEVLRHHAPSWSHGWKLLHPRGHSSQGLNWREQRVLLKLKVFRMLNRHSYVFRLNFHGLPKTPIKYFLGHKLWQGFFNWPHKVLSHAIIIKNAPILRPDTLVHMSYEGIIKVELLPRFFLLQCFFEDIFIHFIFI